MLNIKNIVMTSHFHNGTLISLLVIFVNFGAPQDFILRKKGVYSFLNSFSFQNIKTIKKSIHNILNSISFKFFAFLSEN